MGMVILRTHWPLIFMVWLGFNIFCCCIEPALITGPELASDSGYVDLKDAVGGVSRPFGHPDVAQPTPSLMGADHSQPKYSAEFADFVVLVGPQPPFVSLMVVVDGGADHNGPAKAP